MTAAVTCDVVGVRAPVPGEDVEVRARGGLVLTTGGLLRGESGRQGAALSREGEGDPEQVAAVIAFAASDDASYLTGAQLRVDGGSHI